MNDATGSWETRVADLWLALQEEEPAVFRRKMAALAGELPEGDPNGIFELACACDSTGEPEQAIPLYRAALAAGLSGLPRRRATIQMASSLRNVGDPAQAAALLSEESQQGDDELSTAVSAFHALALSDLGKDKKALALALQALAKHLPRYNASLERYAAELEELSATKRAT